MRLFGRRRLIAKGRHADVFDRGDGTVVRRYRRRDVPEVEADLVAAMPLATELRTRDPNVTDAERAELAAWRSSPAR